MAKHILLTGGTGLLGNELTAALLAKGYKVSHLSRKPSNIPGVKTYLWNVHQQQIDERCIDGIDTIVHLAGAGIAEKRWTNKRKKEIIASRTESIGLVYALLKNMPHQVNAVISASATGYYSDRGDELLTEESPPGHDFLGTCCAQWENAVDEGAALGLRVLKLRTGVVLTAKGGALPQLAMPVKLGIGSPLGSGKQWIPWIHHADVLHMYLFGIEHPHLNGVYNMVAPNPQTNKQVVQAIAKQLKKPMWLPNVPAFALKILLGQMSAVVLGSTRVSAQKIEDAGFKFKFPAIEAALADIYNR